MPTDPTDTGAASKPPGRVAGKVAIVTGGASGMGAAFASRLVQEGASVVIADRDAELGARHAAELGDDSAVFAHLDVTDFERWQEVVSMTVERFGRLNVLVNNAGVGGGGNALEADIDAWRATIDINLTGVFFGMKAALPELMKNTTSSIINVSSIAGLVGFKGSAAYSASKWAVHGLTKTSALDFGQHGVRVNSIHPGSIATPLTAGLKRGVGQIPAGRVGRPDEVAHLVVHLASDESTFTSGGAFAIDGGETAGNNIRGLL